MINWRAVVVAVLLNAALINAAAIAMSARAEPPKAPPAIETRLASDINPAVNPG